MKPKVKRQQLSEESIEAKPRNSYIEPTTVSEEVKNLWRGMLKSTRQDIIGGTARSAKEQLLGFKNKSDGELLEGQAVSLTHKVGREEVQISTEHMEYYRRDIENVERTGETKTEMQVKQAVEEIRAEIRRLMKTSKLVERTVKDATSEKAPIRPGKYHLSFFEFVLSVIKDATRKLEDSVHFGAIFSSKKKQRQYWALYKSKGTKFGLSGERTVATQTG